MDTQTNTTTLTPAEYAQTVDRLAYIKAQIADLQNQEAECKRMLIEGGQTAYDSTLHRASVVEYEGKVFTDWRTIAQHFNPSRQLVTAHTTRGEGFFQVRVVARKTSK